MTESTRLACERKIDAMPVVDGERLVGLVTSTDLLRLLLEHDAAWPLPFDFHVEDATAAAAA